MSNRTQLSALTTLVILQVVMLLALFFQVEPYPPRVIPLGGMAPLLAVSLSLSVAAIVFQGEGSVGRGFILAACLMAMLSYGPQKYFASNFALVWPAVIAAQIAVAALLYLLLSKRKPA